MRRCAVPRSYWFAGRYAAICARSRHGGTLKRIRSGARRRHVRCRGVTTTKYCWRPETGSERAAMARPVLRPGPVRVRAWLPPVYFFSRRRRRHRRRGTRVSSFTYFPLRKHGGHVESAAQTYPEVPTSRVPTAVRIFFTLFFFCCYYLFFFQNFRSFLGDRGGRYPSVRTSSNFFFSIFFSSPPSPSGRAHRQRHHDCIIILLLCAVG